MTDLNRLRFLLEHIHSYDNCLEILQECWKLKDGADGWFFGRIHAIIRVLIDDPDMFYGVTEDVPSPVLDNIANAAIHGIGAIELGDKHELNLAGEELARAAPFPF